jgi:hypothetical protein
LLPQNNPDLLQVVAAVAVKLNSISNACKSDKQIKKSGVNNFPVNFNILMIFCAVNNI